VTSAQRARLVVALGVLNLVLASLAFAVGITAPTQPTDGVAAAPSTAPSPVSLPPPIETQTPPPSRSTPGPTQPTSTPAPTPTPTPTATPPVEPSAIPVPTGVVIVAARPPGPSQAAAPTAPAPTPDPAARPAPTDPPPKPAPTAKPPPKPAPTPKPAAKPQVHPPCPGAVEGPPGHSKGQPWEKPCGKGGSGDSGKSKDAKGGIVIVLPLALSMWLAGGRRRVADSLRRRPSAR
jgi:hypothetical protein